MDRRARGGARSDPEDPTYYFYRGKAVDQLQMHLRGGMGFSADLSPSAPSHEDEGALLAHESDETYRIVTVCFDHEGNELAPVGILPIYNTGCPFPPSAS